MNKDILIGAAIGAAVSGIVTFFVTRHVMKKQFNAYMDEQEAFFVRKLTDAENKASSTSNNSNDIPVAKQEDANNMTEEQTKTKVSESDAPYEIDSNEYGNNDYATKQIYMYTDGVITLGDDQKLTIDEAYDIIGKTNFRNIALSEDATIYVRNPQEGLDFRVESLSYDYYDSDMDETD